MSDITSQSENGRITFAGQIGVMERLDDRQYVTHRGHEPSGRATLQRSLAEYTAQGVSGSAGASPYRGMDQFIERCRLAPGVFMGRMLRFAILAVVYAIGAAALAALPSFDFSEPAGADGWNAAHDISGMSRTPVGLAIDISGADPYLIGPARDYPPGTPLWLTMRLRSDEGGMCQVFFAKDGFTEKESVRFTVPAAEWHEAKVRMPPLGSGYRLRIDPPGRSRACLLSWMRFDERATVAPPRWPVPKLPSLGAAPLRIESGELQLLHGREALGQFQVLVGGRLMGCGNTQGLVGYVVNGGARWFPIGSGKNWNVNVELAGGAGDAENERGLRVRTATIDPDGARWGIDQTFVASVSGTLRVETRVSVDRDRDVLYLPMLTLLPGLGSFGTNKVQALFAGIEYLEKEPSSSTADLYPPASNRQVPETAKITFPLMAFSADDRYIGLAWSPDRDPAFCAVFDSPDRMFGSGGHLMGLLFPGSEGLNREESSLIPHDTARIAAQQTVTVVAVIMGGAGGTVVPAIQEYVRLFGLPALPSAGVSVADYLSLAGHGWLESDIREGDRYRHATPGFPSSPASDAAVYLDYLAERVGDAVLSNKFAASGALALAQVSPATCNASQVGHVRYPVAALVYGSVEQNAVQSDAHAQNLLRRFEPDGSVVYRAPAVGTDYSTTHWSKEANGLAATYVYSLLEEVSFAGTPALIETGLAKLRALNKFRDTVPRGAQTWEIPLHTPDILASAHLVHAYVRGFELTGDESFLDQARYWAWTGVPFVYLTPPTGNPVGLYGTIPVLGATGWTAPSWIGLPVQWCGLVYADALYRLAPFDPAGPWVQIANGIALSGIQQTYPTTDARYRGLLPDSFNLRSQTRNLAAINPATTLASAIRALGLPALYEFRAFREFGARIHVAGAISGVVERHDSLSFSVSGWSSRPHWLLVNGLTRAPIVRINGRDVSLSSPHQFQPAEGRLILRIEGETRVELEYSAIASSRTRVTQAVHMTTAGCRKVRLRGVDLGLPKSSPRLTTKHTKESPEISMGV